MEVPPEFESQRTPEDHRPTLGCDPDIRTVVSKRNKLITAVIETPSGSRNKYSWDKKHHGFRLKKIRPAGMVFPYNFGYVPGTVAQDGDPLDILVLMSAPAFPGCILECLLLGVIEAEQTDRDGKVERNDRLLAAEINDSGFANINEIEELPRNLLTEIQEFFVNYNRMEGGKFKVLKIRNAKTAMKLIKSAQAR